VPQPEQAPRSLRQRLVLAALRSACIAAGGPVSTGAVIEQLSPDERHAITLGPDVSSAVSATLTALCQARYAATPGRQGFERRWSIPGVVPAAPAPLDPTTTRDRVRAHLTAAVGRVGRPVRLDDVAVEAERAGSPLPRATFMYMLPRLAAAGEIVVTGQANGVGGRNLYLPAGHPFLAADHQPAPLTDSDRVLAALRACWRERQTAVAGSEKKPRAVRLAEVCASLAGQDRLPRERVHRLLVSMARGKASPVLKIRNARADKLDWIPREEGPPPELDGSALHADEQSTVRAVEALARACDRLQLALASSKQVSAEAQLDPALRPAGKGTMARALESASRRVLRDRSGGKRTRTRQRVVHVGRVEGMALYALAEREKAARAHFALLLLEASVQQLHADEQIQELHDCELLDLAQARALGLATKLQDALGLLARCVGDTDAEPCTPAAADHLCAQIRDQLRQLEPWTRFASVTARAAAAVQPALWTPAELFQAISPVRPDLATDGSDLQMNHVFRFTVRRIRNPEFISRTHPDRRHRVLWHFDRAHALLRFARENGGSECLNQALVAKRQLGDCRDPHLFLSVLSHGTLEERLLAAGCLAFLWSDSGRAALRRAAVSDPEPGVRQVALWAFGFSHGEGAVALLRNRASFDPSPVVREFAHTSLVTVEQDPKGWWAL
jgi:hypothetical protein